MKKWTYLSYALFVFALALMNIPVTYAQDAEIPQPQAIIEQNGDGAASAADAGASEQNAANLLTPSEVGAEQMAMSQPLAPKGSKAELLPPDITSVLYTFWEYTALVDAKNSRRSSGVQRGVTQDELDREMRMSNAPAEPKPMPPPEEREISLGGIVYTSSNDWTIWLNGERVTPDALPKEIIDLKVSRHHIDVKWLDDYSQRLYPIRLRAHQRFQLDARMFLPG